MNRFVVLAVVALSSCRSATPAVLIRIDAEMPGEHCTNGGVSIRTGSDENNNATLDDSEVVASSTRYVCDGANGTNGTPGPSGQPGDAGVGGHNALTLVTAEPAGTNCIYGGTKVEAGIDSNDDGALSATEITTTRYICDRSSVDAIYFGDLTIYSDDDLALLTNIKVLVGNLDIQHATAGVVSLPTLETVTGNILVGDGGGGGEGPDLRALTPVRELHFPALTKIGGLNADDARSLTTLDFPELARAGDFRLFDLSLLTTLNLPKLVSATAFIVGNVDGLVTVQLPLFKSVGTFDLYDNDLLTTLTVPALESVVGYFGFSYNPVFNECAAWRLANRLSKAPRSVDIYNNDTSTTCTANDYCAPVTVTGLTNLRECRYRQSFSNALTLCQGLATGASLVWFESAIEWSTFSTAVAAGDLGTGWIGYSDDAVEGTFVAVSGFTTYSPTSETNFWDLNEPSGNEHAVEVIGNGLANDLSPNNSRHFFCRTP